MNKILIDILEEEYANAEQLLLQLTYEEKEAEEALQLIRKKKNKVAQYSSQLEEMITHHQAYHE